MRGERPPRNDARQRLRFSARLGGSVDSRGDPAETPCRTTSTDAGKARNRELPVEWSTGETVWRSQARGGARCQSPPLRPCGWRHPQRPSRDTGPQGHVPSAAGAHPTLSGGAPVAFWEPYGPLGLPVWSSGRRRLPPGANARSGWLRPRSSPPGRDPSCGSQERCLHARGGDGPADAAVWSAGIVAVEPAWPGRRSIY